ncbi:MAG: U32 family peptidase [Candidatus Hydrogenedentes bacterium]|nr:U32 family peptidase [Candidatus Hydrogenedentota bacterium]
MATTCKTPVELLAPARDLACGRAAIDCGADAVYIGAPKFGAREKAGNSLDDIAALAGYAHTYWARVYVTINTLLRDDEIDPAIDLAARVCEAGADALIIQDTALLEAGLPPIPLIASTQMHNNTPEKVAFLEKVGFRRVILARELDLDAVRDVRQAAREIELEFFVHGALCVSYSGQCWLSYALGGRSGNRGQCAQPCRKTYTLLDGKGPRGVGRKITGPKHLLSLRDLNLSDHLAELLDAGVTSFKIEGRLKDDIYVANVTAHYRARLDEVFKSDPDARWRKASSGLSHPGFVPNVDKTFNRGFTAYFLHGRTGPIGSHDTPKMTGPAVGRVRRIAPDGVDIAGAECLRPGDGVCFFDSDGELRGTTVNGVRGNVIELDKTKRLKPGMLVYRNHDHEFVSRVRKRRSARRIGIALTLHEAPAGLALHAIDEDGISAEATVDIPLAEARNPEAALERMQAQLRKTGSSEFDPDSIQIEARPVAVPAAVLNGLRREVLDKLRIKRAQNRPRMTGQVQKNDAPFPDRELTYEGNVLNRLDETFYRRHGVTRIQPAAESGLDMRNRKVMTTRYCLRYELGLCGKDANEPLTLVDDEKNRLELRFNCPRCHMEIWIKKRK